MRRRGLRTRAAVIVASLAAVMVGVAAAEEAAAAVYPLSRSGTKDCRNWGNVMVRAEFSRIEGARFATGPVGSPASWRRTAAGTGTDLETIVSWATKPPHTYARWSIATDRAYARAPIGLASGDASCTFDYVGGTVLERRTGGTKTCPSGQHRDHRCGRLQTGGPFLRLSPGGLHGRRQAFRDRLPHLQRLAEGQLNAGRPTTARRRSGHRRDRFPNLPHTTQRSRGSS